MDCFEPIWPFPFANGIELDRVIEEKKFFSIFFGLSSN